MEINRCTERDRKKAALKQVHYTITFCTLCGKYILVDKFFSYEKIIGSGIMESTRDTRDFNTSLQITPYTQAQ